MNRKILKLKIEKLEYKIAVNRDFQEQRKLLAEWLKAMRELKDAK